MSSLTRATGQGLLAKLLVATLLGSCALPAIAQDAAATNVTADQLLNANADTANWLMYNRTYDGQRFSPLDQINKDNVKGLKLAYSISLMPPAGVAGNYKYAGLEGTPLVLNGKMFVTDGWSRVYKLDLTDPKRATIEWIMDPQSTPGASIVEPPNNKGVALLGKNVYSLTFDGRLIATDADTGEEVWEQNVQTDPKEGFTMAPLAIGKNILIGTANGDAGGRHWIEARDAETGEMKWQFYTVPEPGKPGSETWKDSKNNWQNGGGAPWNTGTYDPAANLTYWGTGNPFPDFDPASRPGDNLYTNSVVALDPDTGELKWHFQYTPNESWDYDEIGSHILVDADIDGQTRKLVTHFGRNGMYYGLDRANGSFVNGGQYVDKLTWTKGLDPKTGKPVEYDSAKDVQDYVLATRPGGDKGKVEEACPTLQGGTNYFPVSYNANNKKLYAVAIEGCTTFPSPTQIQMGDTFTGSVVELDPVTGKVVKKRPTPFVQYGGVLTTAGNLVFSGQVDGTFEAMDADTLDVLWSVNLGSQISAPPMTYTVNGKQYIAIEVGASPIINLQGYPAKGADPDAAANMQPASNIYFFELPS